MAKRKGDDGSNFDSMDLSESESDSDPELSDPGLLEHDQINSVILLIL
jgi:hypothetical protein